VEQVVLRDRRLLAQDGMMLVTIAVERDSGAVRAGPEIISRGFIEPDLSDRLMREARDAVLDSVGKVSGERPETTLLQESIHEAVSKLVYRRTKRRPMVIPVVTEL
jgi:ribonuclease J